MLLVMLHRRGQLRLPGFRRRTEELHRLELEAGVFAGAGFISAELLELREGGHFGQLPNFAGKYFSDVVSAKFVVCAAAADRNKVFSHSLGPGSYYTKNKRLANISTNRAVSDGNLWISVLA